MLRLFITLLYTAKARFAQQAQQTMLIWTANSEKSKWEGDVN